jgi:hypothetical protein
VETVEKSKNQNDFSTVPTALGNPAPIAGFPHSHSAYDDYHLSTDKKITHPSAALGSGADASDIVRLIRILQRDARKKERLS